MSEKEQFFVKNSNAEVVDIRYFKKFFNKYWLILAGSVAIALIIAFINNKLSTPIYEVDTSILVNEEGAGLPGSGTQILRELGMGGADKNFANELLVLKSYPLIAQSIYNLDFKISYFENKAFSKTKDLYKSSPFVVLLAQDHPQPINFRFNLSIDENGKILLEGKSENVRIYSFLSNNVTQVVPKLEVNIETEFDSTIQNENYRFKIIANRNINIEELANKKYSFLIQNERTLVRRYQNRLKVEPPDLESTVARLFLKTSTPEKAIDFLAELTKSYLQKDIEKKKHSSLRTIEYIDDQLNVIKDSLTIAEENLQQFRSSKQVINLSMQSEQIYEELRELQKEKAEIQVKLEYFNYIKGHFNEDKEYSDLITPSAMGVNDPVLNNHIQDLIRLNTERNSLIENNQDKSPYLKKINIEIDNLRNIVSENINYIEKTTKISLNNLNSRIAQINTSINQLPQTERELFGIERKFNINDAIYTFLLEKKAEAEIAKASYQADAEIIGPPGIVGSGPVSPKKSLNYLLAILLGLGIPSAGIRAIELIRGTLYEKDEVEKLLNLPIIGRIYHNNKSTEAVVKQYPKSHISESFRKLSLNMGYFLQGNTCKVISVNSTISGEGKSLVAQNLSQALSDKGLKTILIGFDIRKPRLYPTLITSPVIGLSSYLSGQANLEDIIINTPFVNLDVIYAGTTPPNPFELIASSKTYELLESLKEMYEYIIIDTPPIGIVSEGFLLMEKSDLNLYVVRLKRTPKEEFKEMLNELSNKNIKPAVIINDIPLYKKKKTGYGYYEI